MLSVKLLHAMPLHLAAYAGKTCVGKEEDFVYSKENVEKFLMQIIGRGHESVLEHVDYSFKVSNMSRAVLQQLARHRHISLSVLSTRWALGSVEERTDDLLDTAEDLLLDQSEEPAQAIHAALSAYLGVLAQYEDEIPNDTLKYFLPELLSTDLVLTVNARSLRHMFSLRANPPAMAEFCDLMRAIYAEIPHDHRFMFKEYATWAN